MIHVIATVSISPGKRDALLEQFHQLVPKVRAETGCLSYQPVIDYSSSIPGQALLGEDRFAVLEQWESLAALEAHLRAPHLTEFRAKVKHLVLGLELQILQPMQV